MSEQPYEVKLRAALEALQEAKELLHQELSAYPTPISGCDQQYIRLISDRTRISQAVQNLHKTPFVATPRNLDDTTR